MLIQLFKKCSDNAGEYERVVRAISPELARQVESIMCENCFYVEVQDERNLSGKDWEVILWLIAETFETSLVGNQTFLSKPTPRQRVIEVGPRLAFSTPWCSNCISMLEAAGVFSVKRIERSFRMLITFTHEPTNDLVSAVAAAPEPPMVVPLLEDGITALERINTERGLGLDSQDLGYYADMFMNVLQRNPTDAELFDIGQSNSEHSRHWMFGGNLNIDGTPLPETLFQMVKSTLPADCGNTNSVIAFHDNSSAIRGFEVEVLQTTDPALAAALQTTHRLLHPILTAETHNFPTGVAPFAGAETGTGGRLRDVQATGRGAHTLAGVCGYCVGNLHLPDAPLPWEQPLAAGPAPVLTEDSGLPQDPVSYPENLASPLSIIVEASNGASDYGNKYGEPVVGGFARSCGMQLPVYSLGTAETSGTTGRMRVEWLKPVMFTAGVGWLDDTHTAKGAPQAGMLVCKMGGPAYRIGMGGGAASSRVGGASSAQADAQLDFDAVQRGDAEMENRMNRVVRACAELGERNPIVSIHDQGAGGNGNVLKELVDPLGARIQLRAFPLGDPTLSALEIWGAEYQENNAFLVQPGAEGWDTVQRIAMRENCPVAAVGVVTGDGTVVVEADDGSTPVDLPLSLVLGKMPQKEFNFYTPTPQLRPLHLPAGVTVAAALDRVLRLVDVGSKRFLTNKVDRSVSGLVAQQQCVGPLHTPLADVAVLAQSHFGVTGVATAIGEQPLKGLVDPAAQARMTVCEALSNLVFADITCLQDVKASCNWMWPAKLVETQGPAAGLNVEGARMYQACAAIRDCLLRLGVGIDGGKDSLTMAAKVGEDVVRCPGEVVLTCYAPCRDIRNTPTPDLKHPGRGVLLYIDLGEGHYRLGGTALAIVYRQAGNACPDLSTTALDVLRRCWGCLQDCLRRGWLQSGHDRSDGGLLVAVLEMAFAGNVGVEVTLQADWLRTPAPPPQGAHSGEKQMQLAFSEEGGFVLEVLPEHVQLVREALAAADVPVQALGRVTEDGMVRVEYVEAGQRTVLLHEPMVHWRDVWEATSAALELRQCDANCVRQETEGLKHRATPPYHLTFTPSPSHARATVGAEERAEGSVPRPLPTTQHRVAILRQEGTNGDREMASAFHHVGFEVWDVNMHDLLSGQLDLQRFRGIVFCGGFSYADVNGSAKGWAAVIRFNPLLLEQFTAFRRREDTFSLGVCNGCQLMALLGWVPFEDGTVPPIARARAKSDESVDKLMQPTLEGVDAASGAVVVDSLDTTALCPKEQPRFLHNRSRRFESRWSTVRVLPSPAVLLQGMEGSTLGIWSSHGEGRLHCPNPAHLDAVEMHSLAPLRYVDDAGNSTELYPLNPSGTPRGIAALCSANGRHLAIMPHPERSFLLWQIPYMTLQDRASWQAAPWLRLFQNALQFCEQH